jgi:hypothetical protein
MRIKRDKSMILGISVMAAVLSLGFVPAAFAEPIPDNAGTVSHPLVEGGSWCYTYDDQLKLLKGTYAAAQHYLVWGDGVTLAESQDGTPGPKSQAAEQAMEAQIVGLRDAAVARGDSCIGNFHPGSDGAANNNISGSTAVTPSAPIE